MELSRVYTNVVSEMEWNGRKRMDYLSWQYLHGVVLGCTLLLLALQALHGNNISQEKNEDSRPVLVLE